MNEPKLWVGGPIIEQVFILHTCAHSLSKIFLNTAVFLVFFKKSMLFAAVFFLHCIPFFKKKNPQFFSLEQYHHPKAFY